MEILAGNREVFLIIHLVGVALGVGGATFTDVLFFKFLRNFQISKSEDNILKIFSKIIWVALAIIFVTGAALYLPKMAVLNQTPKFLLKMIVFSVIFLNGIFLNLVISPRLINLFFSKNTKLTRSTLLMRKLAFAGGAISMVSWYSALVLGSLEPLKTSFSILLSIYLLILFSAILGSQIFEAVLMRRQ